MTPEEFNRIKEEEKAHLRGLRDLKQQHRDAQRKVSILGALRGMRNPELEADTDFQDAAAFRAPGRRSGIKPPLPQFRQGTSRSLAAHI